jgi:hypothetical protein
VHVLALAGNQRGGRRGLALRPCRLCLWRRFADLRLFAVAFVALVAALIVLQGKTYYLANAVSVLIAGGAVALEAWLRPRGLRIALMAAIVAIGLISAPFALPILPIEQFAAYQRALGVVPHPEQEHGDIGLLSEYYADMFGWRELAAQVAEVYRALPADEQKEACSSATITVRRRDRCARAALRPAPGGQRPQQLLPVGATRP